MPFISKISGINFSASYSATSSYVSLNEDIGVSQFLGIPEGSSSPTLQGRRVFVSGAASTTLVGSDSQINLGAGSIGITATNIGLNGTVSLPIGTYNITASQATTASLANTASLALLANTASFLQNNNPTGLTISVVKGITLQSTDTSLGSVILQAKNIQLTGSVGGTTITSFGDILPGGPYTNNTSSYNLGSPTAAWKDIYVSNGSLTFISGSSSASVQFNNGNITFPGATLTIPTGSSVPTASLALTASTATVSNDAAPTPRYLTFVSSPGVGLSRPNNTLLTNANFSYIPASNTLSVTSSWATSASFTQTASFAQNVYAPSFITYSGGNQANSTLNFADVHSSAGWDNVDAGLYELEMFIVYNAAATSTGARFSLSGSVSQNYLACDVGYSTLTTDRAAFMFRTFDAGTAAASSQLTTGNAAILQGHINITSTGQLRLRFSSEVNASAITVTDVNGYLRRLY